jgi:hypothetical protein
MMPEPHIRAEGPPIERGSIHASYFFDFYDEAFLQEVYVKLLKRNPDSSGKAYYLGAIRAGASRYRILNDLSQSSEGRIGGVKLRGMLPYRCMKVVKAIPIVGRVVQAILFLWRADALLKDLRALENHMYRLSSKVGDL